MVRPQVLAAIPFLLLAVSSWYSVSQNGDATTYSYSLLMPLLIVGIGLAAAAFGFSLYRKKNHAKGIALLLAGPAMIAIAVPALVVQRTLVDGRHFEAVDGMWWNLQRYNIAFDDVADARLKTEEKESRGRSYLVRHLILGMKDGNTHDIIVRNTLQAAWPDIVRHFHARGFKELPEELP